MTPYDVVMFAVIVLVGAVAFYALGRHHGYVRGWVDALDGAIVKLDAKVRDSERRDRR